MSFAIQVRCDEPGCGASFTVGDDGEGTLLATDGMFTVDTGWLNIPEGWTVERASTSYAVRFFCPKHTTETEPWRSGLVGQ